MKNKICLIAVLLILFGIFVSIIDFDDEMDKKLAGHEWYVFEDNHYYSINFNNHSFSFLDENKESVKDFKECKKYSYNINSSVVKLDCDIKNNKIYISKYDKDKLLLTINGIEKEYFATKQLAFDNYLISNYNIDEEELEFLMNPDLDGLNFISYSDFVSLYKNKKKSSNVILVHSEVDYHNFNSYHAMLDFTYDNRGNYYFLDMTSLSEDEITKVNKYLNTEYINNGDLLLYQVGKSKSKLLKTFSNEF